MHTTLLVRAGSTLALGTIRGAGARAYLCVRGGFDVALYLGSRSTFTLGQFGGHGGRALRAGDVLHLAPLDNTRTGDTLPFTPALEAVRTLRVIYGPHGAPEYFSPRYIEQFLATEWEIHFNSSRTGVRLIGPKPEWTREDGGEAGLHPSNIHDNPYAVGAIDFTGDMPVILGPDGPSLGGFVCPVTIIEADLWQIGQLKAGDKVRFVPVSIREAREAAAARLVELETLEAPEAHSAIVHPERMLTSPIVLDVGADHDRLVARLSGDTHVLLELGPAELDLVLRFRGHALMQSLEALALPGVIDVTPGIRSLQIHYQPERLPLARLLDIVERAWQSVLLQKDLRAPSRIVHLPLSWDDPACRLAIDKYMTTVRNEADRLRCELSGDGSRRRLSRRAGRDAARSAPSAGHDQVQPGAHVDGGELGRHRRRVSVRVRHGRSRRISVCRPHVADVEPLSRNRRFRGTSVPVALLRSDPLLRSPGR
jgi:urea carboxylase